jgi:putative peptidoglycan lipid II flippase
MASLNLLRALATVSGMTLLSRILGFVRDFVVARAFGAGLETDAFFVAFRLPNLLRRMFAEGAFSQAFVPILAEYKNKRGEDATRTLVSHVASALGLVVLVISVLGAIFSPAVIQATAPGYADDPDKFALTAELTRITFPYIFFMSLVALSGGILNTWSRFAIPAFTPVLLNLSFIGMALLAAPYFDKPIMALGWGAFIGGLAQLILQIRPLMKIGMLPRFALDFSDPGVRRILKLMAPAVLGVSVSQISLLINTAFASFLPSGSVSWLYYADRLMEFPSGLLGATLGTILLPSLSKIHASDKPEEFSSLLDWGLRLTLMLTLPSSFALALIGIPLVSTLFLHGAFTIPDVYHTRDALMAYSLGLTGLILVKVLAPAFYARQDIRTPVKIGIMSLVITQLMNLAFIGPLQHAGLALSIGLASCINAGMLYRGLRQRGVYHPQPGWGLFIGKVALALVAMGVFLEFTMGSPEHWFHSSGSVRSLHLSLIVSGGIVVYFATLFALGFRVKDFRRTSIH